MLTRGHVGTIAKWTVGLAFCIICCLKILMLVIPFIKNGKDVRHKGIGHISKIPKVMEQGVNMPDVLYHSILTVQYTTGLRKINLKTNKKCRGREQCKALTFLHLGFGNVILDLDLYKYQLSFLRQRHLAATPRPTQCQGCFQLDYKAVITPDSVCRGGGRVFLIILITSIPSEFKARMALRETWLRTTGNNTGSVQYMFLFGVGWSTQQQRQLEVEGEVHKDILQQNYTDNYYNLAYKVMAGFKYVAENCPHVQYVVRTAADNYLNIGKITKWLKVQELSQKSLVGVQIGRCSAERTKPVRQVWSRHYQTSKDYPGLSYPPYCVGTTYIFHIVTVRELLRAAPNVPFFNIEDVWVGLVMEKAGVKVLNVGGFNIQYYPGPDVKRYMKWRKKMGVCTFTEHMLTLHRVTPDDIRAVYKLCRSHF